MTCAMPPPICPAPTTRTCSNFTRRSLEPGLPGAARERVAETPRARGRSSESERQNERTTDADDPAPRKTARRSSTCRARQGDAPSRGVDGEPRQAALPVEEE